MPCKLITGLFYIFVYYYRLIALKKTTNKIIAREFLGLVSSALLAVMLWFVWGQLINMNESEYEKVREKRNLLVARGDDQLYSKEQPFRLRLYYYLKYDTGGRTSLMEKRFPSLENMNVFVKELADSTKAKMYYNFLIEMDAYSDPVLTFNKFYSRITADSLSIPRAQQILELDNKSDDLRGSFFYSKYTWKDGFFLKFILGVVALIFVLRYFIIALIWSIKQMRN